MSYLEAEPPGDRSGDPIQRPDEQCRHFQREEGAQLEAMEKFGPQL